MLTGRDTEILDWIGRLGAAGAEHVEVRFGMNNITAYRRLAGLVAEGLLAHHRLLYQRPGLYVATRKALHWRGPSGLPVCPVTPGTFEHTWQVAGTAAELARDLSGWQVWSERELRWHERQEQRLLASARVGTKGEYAVLHRPDLVLISPQGRIVAIEVELTTKARLRLVTICRGWARARHVDAVYYLAAPQVDAAVGRAVRETRAEDYVQVLGLGDVGEVVAREREANSGGLEVRGDDRRVGGMSAAAGGLGGDHQESHGV